MATFPVLAWFQVEGQETQEVKVETPTRKTKTLKTLRSLVGESLNAEHKEEAMEMRTTGSKIRIVFEEVDITKDNVNSILEHKFLTPKHKRVYTRKKREVTLIDLIVKEPLEDPSSSTPIKKNSKELSQKTKQKIQQDLVFKMPHTCATNKFGLN